MRLDTAYHTKEPNSSFPEKAEKKRETGGGGGYDISQLPWGRMAPRLCPFITWIPWPRSGHPSKAHYKL